MTLEFTTTVWKEGDLFIARCREVEVASQGMTEQDALDNLSEALELHFEPPHATILPE
jgi:predicted RNase H-like HicB family nuclease